MRLDHWGPFAEAPFWALLPAKENPTSHGRRTRTPDAPSSWDPHGDRARAHLLDRPVDFARGHQSTGPAELEPVLIDVQVLEPGGRVQGLGQRLRARGPDPAHSGGHRASRARNDGADPPTAVRRRARVLWRLKGPGVISVAGALGRRFAGAYTVLCSWSRGRSLQWHLH